MNLYTLLIDKLNILGDDIENDNIEELKEEYENLKQLVELKKKELEKNVIKFSNEIDELKEEIIEETKKILKKVLIHSLKDLKKQNLHMNYKEL